jgi:hypothetical protein
MANSATTASQSLKTIGNEITQWENRLEFVRGEVQKQTQVRDSLLATISQKTADFDIYMSQKDAEIKKDRVLMLEERAQLAKDKKDFEDILKQHQSAQTALVESQRHLELEKSKHAGTVQNVQEFITAVRRASGLLDI